MSENQYASRRDELEAGIRKLEDEKGSLIVEIARLREQLENKKLEKKANVLEGEVAALREEMKSLETEIALHTQEPSPQVTQPQVEIHPN